MCKSNIRYDINLYSNKNLKDYLSNTFVINASKDKELIEFIEKLFGKPYAEIPELSPFLMMWIENKMKESSLLSEFVRPSFKTTMKDNTFNFSVAKTFKFLDGLKTLANQITDKDELIEKQKMFSNLVFSSQQAVEEYQVEHMTKTINTVDGNGTELLEYVSERDSKVRASHKAQDGTIRPKTDSYWTDVISLLSEYNCRCSIEPAFSNAQMTGTKTIEKRDYKTQPSDIDFQSGKAIIFSQNLPVFQEIPSTIRRQFKNTGF